MDALATVPTRRGSLVLDPVAHHRVGWYPQSGMIYAEGHPADALVEEDEEPDGRLTSVRELGSCMDRLRERLWDYGIPAPEQLRKYVPVSGYDGPLKMHGPGFGGMRRLDITADLQTVPAAGQAFMHGSFHLLRLSGSNAVQPYFKAGKLETVALRGSRGMLGRIYDKGVESGAAERYTLTRLEAQMRFTSDARLDPRILAAETFGPDYVRSRFHNRFRLLFQAGEGVRIVTNVLELRDRLLSAVESRELTFGQAEKILGSQLLLSAGDRVPAHRNTLYRRRKLVAESGYLLCEGEEPATVDFDELHAALDDAAVWNG